MKLGEGGFGSVVADGKYAVKTFDSTSYMIAEVFATRYVQTLNCPQVISVARRNFVNKTIKTERWHGSLQQAMWRGMTQVQKRAVFKDILLGLSCLESAYIIHADMKPSNVFVNEDCTRATIGDFGISSSSGCARVGWTTPHYSTRAYHNHRSHDSFSTALIAMQLFCGYTIGSKDKYPTRTAVRQSIQQKCVDETLRECLLGLVNDDPRKCWKVEKVLKKLYKIDSPYTKKPLKPEGYLLKDNDSVVCIAYHLKTLVDKHKFNRPTRCHECCESIVALTNKDIRLYTAAMAYIFACVFGYSVKTDKEDRMSEFDVAAYCDCDVLQVVAAVDTILGCVNVVKLMFYM